MPAETTRAQKQTLDQAVKNHVDGRLLDAKSMYEQVLCENPNEPVALHLLGVLMRQTGDNTAAIALIEKAVYLRPDYAEAHNNLANAYVDLGRIEGAVASYQRALAIKPDYAEAYTNLGNVFLSQGQLEEAVAKYQDAIEVKPDYAEAYNNLGVTFKKLGRLEDAVSSYQSAITARPNYAEAHNNLGNAWMEFGHPNDAVACYQKALAINPNYAEARNNLGGAFAELERLDEAQSCYRSAIELDPNHPRAIENLGTLLLKLGKPTEALEYLHRAIDINPNAVNAHVSLGRCLDSLVPLWHTPMMNDGLRNDAYLAALQTAITEDSQVLEIGTGSGLLAMMAARCGAENVTTCEISPSIAAMAKEIVAANGLADVVNVVAKESMLLDVGKDMPRLADVVVSEILSSEFLGEGVLSSIEDAKRRLLAPQGKIIPGKGSIMVALFGGDAVGPSVRVDKACGFDLSKFNRITSRRRFFTSTNGDMEFYSEDVAAFDFDFNAVDYFTPEQKILRIPVKTAGKCYGIIQWNHMQMVENVAFENHPSVKTAASAWSHVVYLFAEPINVIPGQTAVISAVHNRVTPWFTLMSIEDASL